MKEDGEGEDMMAVAYAVVNIGTEENRERGGAGAERGRRERKKETLKQIRTRRHAR